VHFRHRIGPGGTERLRALSVALHGDQAKEKEVILDPTAQEKAITFPTDAKLDGKVIKTARRIAAKHEMGLRQSYARTVPKLLQAQRGWRRPRTRPQARKALRKLKTIAGRLVRELERKLPAGHRPPATPPADFRSVAYAPSTLCSPDGIAHRPPVSAPAPPGSGSPTPATTGLFGDSTI